MLSVKLITFQIGFNPTQQQQQHCFVNNNQHENKVNLGAHN